MIIRAYRPYLFLLLPLLLLSAATGATAQTRGCSDYTAYLRWVTREMPPPGPLYPVVNAVTVRDDLAYVAAGRLDAFWEIGLAQWDIAAGALLVREAGGLVADIDAAGLATGLSAGTTTISAALGMQVLVAARAAKAGQTVEQIIPLLTQTHAQTGFLFTLDDLSYLVRGGRIGQVQYRVGRAAHRDIQRNRVFERIERRDDATVGRRDTQLDPGVGREVDIRGGRAEREARPARRRVR